MKFYSNIAEITGFIVCEKNEHLKSIYSGIIDTRYKISEDKRLVAIEYKSKSTIVLSLTDEEFDRFKSAARIEPLDYPLLSEFYSKGNYLVFESKHLAEMVNLETTYRTSTVYHID